jgi:hypothetical protein
MNIVRAKSECQASSDGLVLGGAPRVLARVDHQRAVGGEAPLAAARDDLVQLGRVEVPVDVGPGADAERVEPGVGALAPVLARDALFNGGHKLSYEKAVSREPSTATSKNHFPSSRG